MKVILDTNVFVSGLFFAGPPYQILKAWRDGRIDLAVSLEILGEYEAVAVRLKSRYGGVDIHPIIELVATRGYLVDAKPLPHRVCVDPDDDVFLACAVASATGTIVSGDRHLLAASGYARIEVLRPRVFVDRYLGG